MTSLRIAESPKPPGPWPDPCRILFPIGAVFAPSASAPVLIDSGPACHLLGIETDATLRRSPFAGAIFEKFVASEIAKHQIGARRRRELYYFRDQQGLEVDFLVPLGAGRVALAEAKASSRRAARDG